MNIIMPHQSADENADRGAGPCCWSVTAPATRSVEGRIKAFNGAPDG